MIRTYDRDLINSFLTQADILPAFFKVSGDPKEHTDVYFMLGSVALFVCIKQGGDMNCHAAVPKGVRGKDAYTDARNLIAWIFNQTDCDRVVTRADKTKKHLLHFNGKLLNRTGEDDEFIYYEVKR